jgi:hypothetical protein
MIHTVTPYGRTGPSSRVRVYAWLDRIDAPRSVSGYVGHGNSSPSDPTRRPIALLAAERRIRRIAAERPERLLLHREASPLSRGGLERRLLASSELGVYDFDDALQWDGGAGGLARRLAPKAPAAVRAARRVVAGNAVLAEWASQHNADVRVIPSCVAPESYRPKADYTLGDPPRLVWIGSPNNEAYLQQIAAPLVEVHRRLGARLTVIGTQRPRLGALEKLIDRIPWSERLQGDLLADFDRGLGPLSDEPYTRQVRLSAVAIRCRGAANGGEPRRRHREILELAGMPAPIDDGEWFDAMVDLLHRSTADRAALGRSARRLVEQHYSYHAWLPAWKEAVGLATSDTPSAEALAVQGTDR